MSRVIMRLAIWSPDGSVLIHWPSFGVHPDLTDARTRLGAENVLDARVPSAQNGTMLHRTRGARWPADSS